MRWYTVRLTVHMAMPMPAQGAAIEPVVLDPAGHDCRGEWGHLGPMDFGVRVSNLDAAVADLRADGIEVHGAPVAIDSVPPLMKKTSLLLSCAT